MMKSGIRILALDDSRFRKTDRNALVVGIVGMKDNIDGVISFYVSVDGSDATEKLISSVKKSRFLGQIKLIAIQGITFAGLNLVDVLELSKKLKVPVVAVTRKKPHTAQLIAAMKAAQIKDFEKRKRKLKEIYEKTSHKYANGFYFEYTARIGKEEIRKFSQEMVYLLRLAHIVAGGVATGESKGRI